MGCTTRTTQEDHREAERWRRLLWCPNPRCEKVEQSGDGAVRFERRYGRESSQLLYRCRACGHRFSLRKGTPLFGQKMADQEFYRIVACLGEGTGIRETARIMNTKPDTVLDVQTRVGKHAERLLNHDMRNLWPREVQLDELWSFLRKKEARLTDLEALQQEWGDCWVWVAYDPETKVVLGFVLGKRTKDKAVRLLKRVHEVVGQGCLPLFTSDELACYEDAIVEVFGVTVHPERRGSRGRFPHPIRVAVPGLNYAVVHKEREDNRVVKVTRRVVLGRPEDVERVLAHSTYSRHVNTSGVERENGKLRADNGRLARKTLQFGKKKAMLRAGLCLSIAYDHYCRPHKGLRQRRRGRPPKDGRRWHRRTPMMALGKTDHAWSIQELVLQRVPGRNVRCYFGGV
jgi:IS1 family transposase